ncbi:MAG TPA: response regulator transcription factor [Anaerolineaceae bacterium]|nr:response regulator transcription factor [Anaerolineaceae bacterium]
MSISKILIVEDEPKVIHLIREVLGAAGFEICTASNGERGVEQAALEQPNLVILDILLPGGMDGYEVARRIHEFSDAPVIFLTGKARESDLLRGFDAGADDYITKPFSSKELLVRVRAVLRRSQRGSAQHKDDEEMVRGEVQIDLLKRKVTVRGQEVHLTHTEYNLLQELASHPNQVMLHEQLLTAVWGPEYRNDIDYLKAFIHTLRQKIEADPSNPKIILRCPGVGYSLACPEG